MEVLTGSILCNKCLFKRQVIYLGKVLPCEVISVGLTQMTSMRDPRSIPYKDRLILVSRAADSPRLHFHKQLVWGNLVFYGDANIRKWWYLSKEGRYLGIICARCIWIWGIKIASGSDRITRLATTKRIILPIILLHDIFHVIQRTNL